MGAYALEAFYRVVLGLERPWQVERVEPRLDEGRIDIWVTHPPGTKWACPTCQKTLSCRDHAEERVWRHLDTCQYHTYIHGRVPRVDCPTHGVLNVRVSWAEAHSRFTLLFERCAIDVLRSTRNITQAREILRLSWDAVQAIQERAVQRGLSRRRIQKLRHLGIDEKSLAKRHRYVSLLIDIDHPRVLEVTPGRDQASADALWNTLPTRQKNQIQAVAMDMWEPYMTSVQENVPQADIVHDKFHVATYLGKAVDTVRKKEHRQLQKEGEETLKGTKYLWLTTPTNWSELQREQFALLQQDHLRVGRAWAIKEAFRHFWNYSYRGAAKTFFRRWFFWATHSRLPPVVDTARTLKRHLTGLLAYTKHRITNATAEGFNSLIQLIKSAARGFRNFNHYRVAILFHCGDLKLHP